MSNSFDYIVAHKTKYLTNNSFDQIQNLIPIKLYWNY